MTEAWPEVAIIGRDEEEPTGSDVTVGQWATEAESAAALDEILDRLDLWKVYKPDHDEVRGKLVQPRPVQVDQGVRIDRILVPNKNLTSLGWRHGIVGIEVKKSGHKIGPAIAQAIDYGRTVWKLPNGGFSVWLDFVFIWPMSRHHGTLASILEQNRIGSAYSTKWSRLYLRCGERKILRVGDDGLVEIGDVTSGRKVGSR